jgi:hypothetical protein
VDRIRHDAWSTAVARTKALLTTAREVVAHARNQRNIPGLRRALHRKTNGKK